MCENSIRVLRIIARLNIGGPAIHTILLTRHMQSLGYETLLVTGQVGAEEGDMTYLAESQAVKPIIIPQLGRRLHPADDLMVFFRVLRLLFKFRPQIVHTHTAKAGTVGRLAALLYNTVQSLKSTALCLFQKLSIAKIRNPQSAIRNLHCKVVHTFHGHVLRGYFSPFKSRLFQRIEKILAKFTDAIVVVSEQQKDELCRDFGIGRRQQYQVIPLGFDLTPFSRGAADMGQFPARLGPAENSGRLVGIIGRLTGIKNHRLFLKAAQVLVKNKGDTRAQFLIVGDGELRKDLESLTHTLHLEDRVIFTGWMKDLTPLYADLDVLALTSNNEGTPVAMIEAMAAGVPVVATDVGGVRELISDCGSVLKPPGAMRNAGMFSSRQAQCGNVLKPPGAMRNAGMFSSRQALLTTKAGEFEVCERGILVKPGNVRGFAKGLQYLLERPHVCKQMGQRGREYVLRHHGKERLVADTDRLYRSLLE